MIESKKIEFFKNLYKNNDTTDPFTYKPNKLIDDSTIIINPRKPQLCFSSKDENNLNLRLNSLSNRILVNDIIYNNQHNINIEDTYFVAGYMVDIHNHINKDNQIYKKLSFFYVINKINNSSSLLSDMEPQFGKGFAFELPLIPAIYNNEITSQKYIEDCVNYFMVDKITPLTKEIGGIEILFRKNILISFLKIINDINNKKITTYLKKEGGKVNQYKIDKSFFVSEHVRTLKAQRYKVPGKKLIIKQYQKGEGKVERKLISLRENQWKNELELLNIVQRIYPDEQVIHNKKFCRESTLRIDVNVPNKKIAFEYDGYQHYRFPNVFHKTREEFIEQQNRDKKKDELCRDLGITLIRIKDNQPLTEEYIRSRIEKPQHLNT